MNIILRDNYDSYVIEFATLALKDPINPTRCGGVLDFALSNIDEDNYSDFPDEFWTTLYGFLLAKRTDVQLKTVLRKLAQCSCKDDTFGLHSAYTSSRASQRRVGNGLPNEAEAQNFIIMAFGMLHWALDPAALSVVEVTKGISRKWPRKIPDVLPNGPDQLVESFIRWHRIVHWTSMPMVVRSLLQVVNICGNLLWDSLIKFDAMNNLFLSLTRAAMYSQVRLLEEKGTPEFNSTNMFDIIITDFLDYLSEVCGHPSKSSLLMGGGETKALQLCSIILYLLPSFAYRTKEDAERFQMTADMLAEIGRLVFRFFRMPLFGRPKFKVHPRIVIKDALMPTPKDLPPPPHAIALAMMIGRMDRPCAATSCQLSFTHVSNEFKMCNRCMSVGYCGRPCQVGDWKDEEFPHKRVCSLLCKIVEARGGWKAPIPDSIVKTWDSSVDGAINRHDLLLREIPELVLEMRREGTISEEDYAFLTKWAERTYSTKVLKRESEKDAVWHPGFDDYDEVLKKIMALPKLKTPEPRFLVV